MTLVCRGVNFYNMEIFILERRWETFANLEDMKAYQQYLSQTMTINFPPLTVTFMEVNWLSAPTNNVLTKCFLAAFLKDENLYILVKYRAGALREILHGTTPQVLYFP